MERNEISLRSLRGSRPESNASMRPEHQSLQSSVTHFPGPQSTPVPNNESWVHPAFRTNRDSYAVFHRPGEEEEQEHSLKTGPGSPHEFRKSDGPASSPSPSLLYRIAWSRGCKVATALAVVAVLITILTLSICIPRGCFQHRNGTTEIGLDGRTALTTTATTGPSAAEDTSVLAAWPTITASASNIIHVHMDAARAQSEPTTLLSAIAPGTSPATTVGVAATSTDRAF